MKYQSADEFFKWFRSQDTERLFSKELTAKDAWDYQQAKLSACEEKLVETMQDRNQFMDAFNFEIREHDQTRSRLVVVVEFLENIDNCEGYHDKAQAILLKIKGN